MRTHRASLLLAIALTLLPGRSAAAPVVWMLGDSLSASYAPYVAAQNPTWQVVNLGLGAETAALGLERTRLLLATRGVPDVVVLQWGTNDTVLRVPHGDFVADFIESAELLRIAGAVAIVVKPIGFAPLASLDPSIDPEVRDLLRLFFKDTVKQQRAVAIAARNLGLPHCAVRTRPKRFWLDAFHPTLDAYRDLVAPQLAACIRRFAGL